MRRKPVQVSAKHSIWFCGYIELGFIEVDTFWILVLCIQCAVCVWLLIMSQGTGAVTPQTPGRPWSSLRLELWETNAKEKDPSESLGFTFWQSRENTCGAFAVALLPMLTTQGKENSWSVGLQGKIYSEIWNQLIKEKTHPETSVSGLWDLGDFVLVPLGVLGQTSALFHVSWGAFLHWQTWSTAG